jgi:hypothetical protein
MQGYLHPRMGEEGVVPGCMGGVEGGVAGAEYLAIQEVDPSPLPYSVDVPDLDLLCYGHLPIGLPTPDFPHCLSAMAAPAQPNKVRPIVGLASVLEGYDVVDIRGHVDAALRTPGILLENRSPQALPPPSCIDLALGRILV